MTSLTVVSQTSLEGVLGRLETSVGHTAMQTATEQLRDLYGVRHVVYHWIEGTGTRYGCTTYPRAWIERYIEQNYVRIDPAVLNSHQSFRPVLWSSLDWSSRAAQAFLADAEAHGIGNQGVSLPVRGPRGQHAVLSFNDQSSDEDWAAFVERNRRDFILIAYVFNQKALELGVTAAADVPRSLSAREIDALTLLSSGMSRSQIAERLAISEHTLRVYIEGARTKLDAVNTMHAVVKAISAGLIIPEQ